MNTDLLQCGWLTALLLATGIAYGGDAPRRGDIPSPVGTWMMRTWETEDGLPENSATAMVQTPDHYLWFGTFNGLVRFDGVQFTVFDPSNTPGLPSPGIVNLHLDRRGRLWISTLEGLVWRDGGGWGAAPASAVGPHEFIRSFAERPNGDLLLTTFGGRLLEHIDGRFTELPSPPGLPNAGYFAGVDEEGHWWAVQAGFVGRWTGTAWERRLTVDAQFAGVRERIACTQAREGGLWILTGNELHRIVRGTRSLRQILPESVAGVWSMTEDRSGNLWICSSSQGVRQVLPDHRVLTWTEGQGLAYHGARFAFEDVEGNLWLGTSGGGLTRLKARRFESVGLAQGLSERVVKTVSPAPGGRLWIGTYGRGLFRLDNGIASAVPLIQPETAGVNVQSVLTDREGRTWVGTYGHGLHRLDPSGVRTIPSDQTGGGNPIALFEDSKGRIWISGGQGVACFDSGTFRPCLRDSGQPLGAVHGFHEDAEGTLWLSNYQGVFRLEGDRFVEARTPEGASFPGIACFHSEPDGTLWMGSLNDGLWRWQRGMVSRITPAQGLPVRGIYAILADDQGVFWMASNRGILRSPSEALHAAAHGGGARFVGQLLDRNDGLPSIECPAGQQPIAARGADGRLWFATLKGVASIDPARFRTNPIAPPSIIERFAYYRPDRESPSRSSSEIRLLPPFTGPVELPPDSRRLELHFTAPSFTSPEKVRFRYRLSGYDPDWRETVDRRAAYFEELGHGRYVFEVRAANEDGQWHPETARLAFTVLPHFWQTRWFWITSGVALLAGAGTGVLRLQRRLEGRLAERAEFTRRLIRSQENERRRVARELHDDVTQRLARLAIDAGQMELQVPEPDRKAILVGIREGLARLSEDVHSLSYQMHPSIIEDLGLVEALRVEGDRVSRHASVAVKVIEEGLPRSVPREPALCLFRIAQEALRNVVRHAQARHVAIFLRGLDGGLELAVQDDGIGFDPAVRTRGMSLGLPGMRERVTLLSGRLDLETAPGQGTTLVAWLPLGSRREVPPEIPPMEST